MDTNYTVENIRLSGDASPAPNSLDAFFDHLTTVFGPVGTPRLYFQNHWFADPNRDDKGVFVAICKSPAEIASSVRVYRRNVNFLEDLQYSVGGIGDVATLPSHTRRGLAQRLLQASVDYMAATGIDVSVLHTSTAVPLYAKLGWKVCVMFLTTCEIGAGLGPLAQPGLQCRQIDFEADLETIKALYRISETQLVASFRRDSDFYWKEYIGNYQDSRRTVISGIVTGQDGVAGYAILEASNAELAQFRSHPETASAPTINIREVFVGRPIKQGQVELVPLDTFARYLESLVAWAISRLGLTSTDAAKLRFPSALLPNEVLDRISASTGSAWASRTHRQNVQDGGWMWKIIRPIRLPSPTPGEEQQVLGPGDEDDLAKYLRQPVGIYCGCAGNIACPGTERYGFLRSDSF
ncbi:acyl-CoA N-acyltransferase [Polychytrium aggregatum]|uniref:acyl-CoA N-acyltransferase n=1 Tax=Polychytrium aggregatum TaxID=110093 RepID=UPI0022FEE6FE|nr:acyl-CoA N-acyltransferase [Polychytrium aggregatum]KAI9205304.1 acyl-CoA N-acyltransferase [Polychytrium aggregatum]